MPELTENLGTTRLRSCYKCGKPNVKEAKQTLCLDCAAPKQANCTEELLEHRNPDRRVRGRRSRFNKAQPALVIAAMLFNLFLMVFGVYLSKNTSLSPLKAISVLTWASLCIVGTSTPLPFQKFIRDFEKLAAYVIGIGTVCVAVFMVFGNDPFALSIRNLLTMPFVVMGLFANVHVLDSSIACRQEEGERTVSLALDLFALLTVAGVIGVGAYGVYQDVADNNMKLQSEFELARQREITTCNDKDFYLGEGNKKITDKRLRFSYNMQNAPKNIREDELSEMLSASVKAWSACGIPVEHSGPTALEQGLDDMVVIVWRDATYFKAGTQFSIFYGGERPEKSIWLNSNWASTAESIDGRDSVRADLQHDISQEIGHELGLMSVSPRALDTMATASRTTRRVGWGELALTQGAAPSYAQSSLPTACDIRRCRAVNEIQ